MAEPQIGAGSTGGAGGIAEDVALRRRDDVESEILADGSCLLFDPRSNNGYALNAAGALIWDYCDGALSAGAIADELAHLLPDAPDMRTQALAMIATLSQLGLLQRQE
ncbi:MAG TPA: PqqD family protein [Ktedonobacterales bacterium]